MGIDICIVHVMFSSPMDHIVTRFENVHAKHPLHESAKLCVQTPNCAKNDPRQK